MSSTHYDILFSVKFTHRYFTGGRFTRLRVKPNAATLHFLNRNKMIFKLQADGFGILYEAQNAAGDHPRETLLDGSLLRFVLMLEDAVFYNYTADYIKNVSGTLSYFHNGVGGRKVFSPGRLHAGEFVGSEDVVALDKAGEEFFTKPFGLIDIQLAEDMPAQYEVCFKEKATYWRYHLVADHLKELDSPGIAGPETFSEPAKTLLPGGREALTFVSANPIALSETGGPVFQLLENSRVVMRALPGPDAGAVSRIKAGAGQERANYSEIFIY